MDLSRLSIEPRLRNGWQAIDLGFAMARQWWWPSFLVWAIPSAVVYLLFSLVLPEYTWLSIFTVWWLKPLWDRLPLALGSRALFSEAMDVKATLRNMLRIVKTDCFASLTWRRLSPSRSFDLPVTVLEGLRGAERSRRLSVLHQSYGNAAIWLTVVLVHIEMFLGLGIWSMAVLLVPEEIEVDWLGIMLSGDMISAHFSNVVTLCAMALVGPFYSLAGFSLYICRRIELEAWDIELRFRHLAERCGKLNAKRTAGKAAAGVLALILGGLITTHSPPSWAQDNAEPEFVQDYYRSLEAHQAAMEAKGSVLDLLAGEDFHRVETESGWRFKDLGADPEGDPEWLLALVEFIAWMRELTAPLDTVFTGLAVGFEVLIWLLVAGLVGLLVYRYRKGLVSVFGLRSQSSLRSEPEVLFGLDVRKQSLPRDVCAQVQIVWRDGRHREAIALLYRATLSRLIHQFAFQFYAGYTERECVAVVQQDGDQKLSEFMQGLTRVWQQLAYAHRLPQSAQVDELCQDWQTLFGAGDSNAS